MRRVVVAVAVLVVACGGAETSVSTAEGTVADTAAQPAGSDSTAGTEAPVEAAAPSTTSTLAGVEPPPLTDIFWEVGDYRLPNGAITNVWKTTVDITINADGTVTGSSGCNDYEGTWTVSGPYDEYTTEFFDPNDGQAITFDALTSGDLVCEDEDVMIQEGEILDILEQTARWVLIEGNLSLRDSEGKFLLEASPG